MLRRKPLTLPRPVSGTATLDLAVLPDDLDQTVRAELEPGERLVWLQQPSGRSPLPWFAYAPALFGIPFTAFAVFWMVAAGWGVWGGGAVGPKAPNGNAGPFVLFPLFGLPFVFVGLGMLSGPFWIRRRMRRSAAQTAYAITDRRAIVFDGGYQASRLSHPMGTIAGPLGHRSGDLRIQSYAPEQLARRERVQNRDGTGDILFGDSGATPGLPSVVGQFATMMLPGLRSGFYSIADVKQVDDLLRDLAKQASPSSEGR